MALKQQNKTKWNGKKQHEDGFNTDKDMAYSTKGKKTLFEIQRRDIHILRGLDQLRFLENCPPTPPLS